jgi:hypothetical protein
MAVEFDPLPNTNCSLRENCSVTDNSEVIAMCKEMPVILVIKVVDKKRIYRKRRRAKEEERHKGPLTPLKSIIFYH